MGETDKNGRPEGLTTGIVYFNFDTKNKTEFGKLIY